MCNKRYKRAIQEMSNNTAVRMTDVAGESDQEEVTKEKEAKAYVNYDIKTEKEEEANLGTIRYEHVNQYDLPPNEQPRQLASTNPAAFDDEHIYDTPPDGQ